MLKHKHKLNQSFSGTHLKHGAALERICLDETGRLGVIGWAKWTIQALSDWLAFDSNEEPARAPLRSSVYGASIRDAWKQSLRRA